MVGDEPPLTAATADARVLSEEDIAQVYLTLLSQPAPDRESLVAAGIEESTIALASVALIGRGLLIVAEDGSWDVPSPDMALDAWASDTERRARSWRASANELQQIYFSARQHVVESTVRELSSLADIASATATITAAAQAEILCLRADSRRTRQLLLDPYNSHREIFRNARGEVIDIRAVYDPAVLDTAGALDALRERVIGGEDIRISGPLHFSAIIVDEQAAVIEFTNQDPSGSGALLIRSRSFVQALVSFTEATWQVGVPLTPEDTPSSSAAATRDAIILRLLASGASDSTITRRLGISQRTVERRVRHLMDSLGAETRFQAGVEAARQGLV